MKYEINKSDLYVTDLSSGIYYHFAREKYKGLSVKDGIISIDMTTHVIEYNPVEQKYDECMEFYLSDGKAVERWVKAFVEGGFDPVKFADVYRTKAEIPQERIYNPCKTLVCPSEIRAKVIPVDDPVN